MNKKENFILSPINLPSITPPSNTYVDGQFNLCTASGVTTNSNETVIVNCPVDCPSKNN